MQNLWSIIKQNAIKWDRPVGLGFEKAVKANKEPRG